MEVLITSKTHKGKAACVGGMVISNNRFVRLLNPGNWDQYADTDFDIGDIWDINFTEREDVEPPHIEDIIIHSKRFLRKVDNFTNFISNSGIQIFRGSPNNIFDGLLGWTGSGSGYIGNRNNLPQNSVGFWISDKNLTLDDDEKHYIYPSSNAFSRAKRFPYVGFEPKEELIELQKQVETVLKEFNIRKDFQFLPHLTLARVNFVKDKEDFIQKVKKITTKKTEVEINNFKLIKSTLTPEGPVYEDLDIFPKKQ